MNLIVFGRHVLEKESLTGWMIIHTCGDEGFCNKTLKVISVGEEAIEGNNRELMLHEIAHCLTDTFHYSDEFEGIVKRLEKRYLKEVKK